MTVNRFTVATGVGRPRIGDRRIEIVSSTEKMCLPGQLLAMGTLSNEELRATADRLIAAHQEASRTNDWLFFVDEIYAVDCIYTCEYAGVMEVTANGIDEIKATHYGRDMQVGWEGWTFPYEGVYTGKDNTLITRQFEPMKEPALVVARFAIEPG